MNEEMDIQRKQITIYQQSIINDDGTHDISNTNKIIEV